MPTLFVLDAPEFQPIVDAARRDNSFTVAGPSAGYFRLSSIDELRIQRSDTGVGEAIWFGVATGGYRGGAMTLTNEILVICADPDLGRQVADPTGQKGTCQC